MFYATPGGPGGLGGGGGGPNGGGPGGGPGAGGIFSPWSFLTQLPALTHLTVTHSAVEPLLALLGGPGGVADDDAVTALGGAGGLGLLGGDGGWVCPELKVLVLRMCHPQGDAVAKLVSLVDARNPDLNGGEAGLGGGGTGGTPTRLKCLELNDCLTVGVDVLAWLKSRVEEVIVIEPAYER